MMIHEENKKEITGVKESAYVIQIHVDLLNVDYLTKYHSFILNF